MPVFFLLYYLAPSRLKNGVCLVGSLVFYAWGDIRSVPLLLLSILVSYGAGRYLGKERPQPARRRGLALACVFHVGLLVFYKYLPFLVDSVCRLAGIDGPEIRLSLPLGISFYTFQAVSYVVDVYRGQVPPQRRFWRLALYLGMFPRLTAGPIVRYGQIAREIDGPRNLALPEVSRGVVRFLLGLGKKVLFANALGELADAVWQTAGLEISVASAWLGLIAYTLQIYFDFSGYSDMAIGLGWMMGFHFCENFHYPYLSGSVSEFWRRWHISLGSWFRDYVYIPLGGSRIPRGKQVRNLLIVWGLTGLWHGASWTFVLWGLYYGVLICLEKLLQLDKRRMPVLLRHGLCLVLVMLGWVFFRSETAGQAVLYLGRLVGVGVSGGVDAAALLYLHDDLPLLLLAALGATPWPRRWAGRLLERLPAGVAEGLRGGATVVLLALCTLYLVNSTYNPFIYLSF